MWCWLLLSAIRFVAVYKPIVYRVKWSGPRKALMMLVATCAILEAWILRLVTYEPTALTCYDDQTLVFVVALHLFEITWSYIIPLVLITACDLLVLCRNHNSGQFIVEFTGKRIKAKSLKRNRANVGGTVREVEENHMNQRFISVC